jgi:hypothetical protein
MMKTKTLFAVALLTTLPFTYASAATSEAEPLGWLAGKNGCHVLLTEQECQKHRAALTALASYSQRYAYLESQGIELRDRETMCNCTGNTRTGGVQRTQRLARH